MARPRPINKNREYPSIDARIKQTYIAESTAQKTKLYDMYARFFRWASDRLAADGVLAFVTNRSFIESRTFDGFRKTVTQEFSEAYIVDLGGDVRANPKLSGTRNNVFGIQTGVAISFFVKRHGAAVKKQGCRVFYARRPEMETAEEKLAWLGSSRPSGQRFEEVRPDRSGNWLNLSTNDFDQLIPVANKQSKGATRPGSEQAIFKLFSLGYVTARDDWMTDWDIATLGRKVHRFCDVFDQERRRWNAAGRPKDIANFVNREIKWTSELEARLARGTEFVFDHRLIVGSLYRPFAKKFLYFTEALTHRRYQLPSVFPAPKRANLAITFLSIISSWPLSALGTDVPFDYCLLKQGNGATQSLPLWSYASDGTRSDNITDWALAKFQKHYQPGRGRKAQPITKEAIFHYVYAVLHDPLYREKYAQNLKREFPRIPLYGESDATFWQWAGWGAELMALHIGYETVEPFALTRTDVPDEKVRAAGQSPKPSLKADKEAGRIVVDSETTLAGVPASAWRYLLGNRSAIEWVLDQHKEKKPKDPTIREKFDTYRFADHKERVIDLLARVTTVSVETMRIVDSIRLGPR